MKRSPSFLRWPRFSTLAALLLPLPLGCSGESCPERPRPALRITVENGADGDRCAYEVRAKTSAGRWFELECAPTDRDCECVGGGNGLTFEVELNGTGPSNYGPRIETLDLTVDEDSCGAVTKEARFSRPPIDEFLIESCRTARAHFDDCETPSPIGADDCVDTRPRPPSRNTADSWERRFYGCFTSASCEDLRSAVCTAAPSEDETNSVIACSVELSKDVGVPATTAQVAETLANACQAQE